MIKENPTKKIIKKLNQVPSEITENIHLNEAIKLLPNNYSFEIHKIIHRVRTLNCKRVAMQFPDGL